MLPFVLASLVCLAAAALLVKNETIQVEFSARETIKHPKSCACSAGCSPCRCWACSERCPTLGRWAP